MTTLTTVQHDHGYDTPTDADHRAHELAELRDQLHAQVAERYDAWADYVVTAAAVHAPTTIVKHYLDELNAACDAVAVLRYQIAATASPTATTAATAAQLADFRRHTTLTTPDEMRACILEAVHLAQKLGMTLGGFLNTYGSPYLSPTVSLFARCIEDPIRIVRGRQLPQTVPRILHTQLRKTARRMLILPSGRNDANAFTAVIASYVLTFARGVDQ
jgi:hypothetical protein